MANLNPFERFGSNSNDAAIIGVLSRFVEQLDEAKRELERDYIPGFGWLYIPVVVDVSFNRTHAKDEFGCAALQWLQESSNGREWCRARLKCAVGVWACTREPGHQGVHVAHAYAGVVCAVWPHNWNDLSEAEQEARKLRGV